MRKIQRDGGIRGEWGRNTSEAPKLDPLYLSSKTMGVGEVQPTSRKTRGFIWAPKERKTEASPQKGRRRESVIVGWSHLPRCQI